MARQCTALDDHAHHPRLLHASAIQQMILPASLFRRHAPCCNHVSILEPTPCCVCCREEKWGEHAAHPLDRRAAEFCVRRAHELPSMCRLAPLCRFWLTGGGPSACINAFVGVESKHAERIAAVTVAAFWMQVADLPCCAHSCRHSCGILDASRGFALLCATQVHLSACGMQRYCNGQ